MKGTKFSRFAFAINLVLLLVGYLTYGQDTLNNVDESYKHHTEQKKPHTKW